MKTAERRMISFFEVVAARMGDDVKLNLQGIWAEVCVYTKCKTLVKKGKRQGQECGKACPYSHTQCICHLPRSMFSTEQKQCELCSRLCKKGETLCPAHLNPCQYILTRGKNKGGVCSKKSDKTQLCKSHRNPKSKASKKKKNVEEEVEEEQEEDEAEDEQDDEEEEEAEQDDNEAEEVEDEQEEEQDEAEKDEEDEEEQDEPEEQVEQEAEYQPGSVKPVKSVEEEVKQPEKEAEKKAKVRKFKSYSPELPDPDDEPNPFEQYPDSEEECYTVPVQKLKPQIITPSSCTFVLTSGIHKGNPCGKKRMEGKDMCVIHKKK